MTSRAVNSNQQGIHENLDSVVVKHLKTSWRKPISHFSESVFATIQDWIKKTDRPLLLDSGCGTGDSSINLALRYPTHNVLGFDRSEVRLDKLKNRHTVPDNCLVVRADAEDLWRQLLSEGVKLEKHFVLFPNPYPKAAQLNKRWHGSPVFPTLVQLSPTIELRSNWKTYLVEFSRAWEIATGQSTLIESYNPEEPITAFETKYKNSDQTLWRLICSTTNKGTTD